MFNENSKHKCIVQANRYTEQLGKEITRVMIFGDVYTVVGIDRLSAEGIIGVEFVEGKINPALDNLELQIADYYRSNKVEDTTSDDEYESIYEDVDSWVYINGDDEVLLGENAKFNILYEPKIIEHDNPKFVPYKTEFELTYEDGTVIDNGNDFSYYQDNDEFYIKTAAKVPLLGIRMNLTAKVYFEERTYTNTDEYTTEYKVSTKIRKLNVSGW